MFSEYKAKIKNREELIFYGHHMICLKGKSMGNRQVDPATTSESMETFRVCRVFCADHFSNKFSLARTDFYKDTGRILFKYFCVFCKKKQNMFFEKSMIIPHKLLGF